MRFPLVLDIGLPVYNKIVFSQKYWAYKFKGLNNNNNNNDNNNLKRETEYLLIAAQNNAVRTNNTKARIDKTQQNSKCRLCGNRGETMKHIISECSKLAQKERIRLDAIGWVKWPTGNCARNFNSFIWTNGKCTTQHQFWKMTLTNSSRILTYKRINKSRPDDQTL